MDWNDLIQQRHTNFAWQDKDIPDDILKEVCEEVYNNVPSKNLKFPYEIVVYKNKDAEIKKEIATICHRNKDKSIDDDWGNPQVLAPVLFAFSRRDYKDAEMLHQKTYVWSEDGLDRYGFLEIGVVSMFLVMALTNRGIQTGFCQNIGQDAKRAQEIFSTSYPVQLLVGAGYGKGDGVYTYTDPRNNKERESLFPPSIVDKIYPRPPFTEVFKFK